MNARCPPPATMRIAAADSPDTGSTGTPTRSHPVRAVCPSAPVTLIRQGGVTSGDTFREPEVGTTPMSGVISVLAALVDDHVNVVL